jgi:hypothetical protein
MDDMSDHVFKFTCDDSYPDMCIFHLSSNDTDLFEFHIWKKGVYVNRRKSAVWVTPNNSTSFLRHTQAWNSSVQAVMDFLNRLGMSKQAWEFGEQAKKLGWKLL